MSSKQLGTPAAITDFTHGSDILQFSASTFGGGLQSGAGAPLSLTADALTMTNTAGEGMFIFDTAGPNLGKLYWDVNGGSSSDAVHIVELQNVSTLLTSDLFIV
ncbi:MAG: hypothetical protein JW395_0539 [Nitrospira sp.]|nr:hypothetical protein [Nitrospira sp.]